MATRIDAPSVDPSIYSKLKVVVDPAFACVWYINFEGPCIPPVASVSQLELYARIIEADGFELELIRAAKWKNTILNKFA